nr:UDP-glucose 4-epimerase GalE [uncultured Gellertiella sp.]
MRDRKILVTGGAGYIGSHTCMVLKHRGFEPVVYDNLSNGHAAFVKWGLLEEGDIRDRSRIEEVLRKHQPEAVIHFAGLIEVSESVRDPLSFYEVNVAGSLSLLSACIAAGVDKFVFSSTCATYGIPRQLLIDEGHVQDPVNPYGRTKLLIERAILDLEVHGLRSVILRYFNAGGADPGGKIGEKHDPETHAIPLAIDTVLGRRELFRIFGNDYNTRDGTCVRDYIHVLDLADAHVRAVDYLLADNPSDQFNLGTGRGTTVGELVAAVEKATGRPLPKQEDQRRPGDVPQLVANNAKAQSVLGWQPVYELEDIIRTAWDWHRKQNT